MFVSMWNDGGPEMAEIRAVEIPGRRGTVPARLYAATRCCPTPKLSRRRSQRAGVELHVFEDGPHAFAQIFALDDGAGRGSGGSRRSPARGWL